MGLPRVGSLALEGLNLFFYFTMRWATVIGLIAALWARAFFGLWIRW